MIAACHRSGARAILEATAYLRPDLKIRFFDFGVAKIPVVVPNNSC